MVSVASVASGQSGALGCKFNAVWIYRHRILSQNVYCIAFNYASAHLAEVEMFVMYQFQILVY